jgi:hypothetical protein
MRIIGFAALLSFVLVGCQTTEPVQKKTSLEIQAVQAKVFEHDKALVFKAVLSVLQDVGYVVQAANLDTGIVTAQSPTKQDTSGSAAFAAALSGVRSEVRALSTVTIEDIRKDQTKVRINIVAQRFRSARSGQQATDEVVIQDPQQYARFFERLDEAIFIRTAQK